MKSLIIPFLFIAIAVTSCNRMDWESEPACDNGWIKEEIKTYDDVDAPLDSVVEMKFRGEYVYFFAVSAVTDASSPVYSCSGEELCYLGGIAGNVTCQGVNFYDNATDRKLVWKR